MRLCSWWWPHRNRKILQRVGATAFGGAMASAAEFGHVEIVELCKEWERQILIKLWFTLRYLATSKL